jgi:peptide/nickel transport system substrate-binding protein
MRKKLLSFVLASIIGLSLVGCGSSAATSNTAAEQSGGILRTAIFQSPSGVFQPAFATNSYDFYVTDLVFESLLRVGEKGDLEACLADKWKASEDGKVFTFTLRDGLKFHDGQPVTAEDVKYSIQYVGQPNYKGARGSYVNAIKGIEDFRQGKTADLEGIKVIDDKTVEITTKDTYSSGLIRFGLNFKIFAKHIWDKVDVAQAGEATDLLRNPVGTGAFKMSQFVPDQYVEFAKNDDYWGGKPKLDKIILQNTTQDVAQAQLLKGEVDQMYLTTLNKTDEDMYKAAGMNVVGVAQNAYQYLAFNLTKDEFKDKKIRQAFAYAMDRDAVVNNLMSGHGSVANNPYPANFWAHPDGLNEYKYDPKKALELFKEAGWTYNESDKKMYINGKPAKFTLKYSKGNPVTEKSAPLFQQNMKDVGIDVDLQIMEFATMFDQAKKGDFELAFIGQGNEIDADLSKFYYSSFIKPIGDNSGSNFIRYKNSELDSLIDEGFKTVDQTQKANVYKKIGTLLNQELPVIYRYHWDDIMVYTGKLKGRVHTTLAQDYYYKVQDWYLTK